jgi:hypothetical protein
MIYLLLLFYLIFVEVLEFCFIFILIFNHKTYVMLFIININLFFKLNEYFFIFMLIKVIIFSLISFLYFNFHFL